jgi:hypothetical protein
LPRRAAREDDEEVSVNNALSGITAYLTTSACLSQSFCDEVTDQADPDEICNHQPKNTGPGMDPFSW